MDYVKSPNASNEKTCAEKLSQQEIQQPLSPVLGTGQSLKLLKIRKERNKRNSKKVAQKLENSLKPKDKTEIVTELNSNQQTTADDNLLKEFEDILEEIKDVPFSSSPRLSLEYDLNALPENRIQILEEFEAKKRDVVKALSFSNIVTIDALKSTPESVESPQKQDRVNLINNSLSEKEMFDKDVEQKTSSILQNKITDNMKFPRKFQTGTGKNIQISEDIIQKSVKLFDDILNPNCSQHTRNKKFSYLSKSRSPDKIMESHIVPHGKNIFDGENIDDSKLPQSGSFDRDFISSKNGVTCRKIDAKRSNDTLKNIFKDESFDDLKMIETSGFKTASATLNEVRSFSELKKFNDCAVSSAKNETKSPEEKTLSNNFSGDYSNDLKIAQNSGSFRTSVIGLKDEVSNKLLQNKSKNIFTGQNFDDSQLHLNGGFKKALAKTNTHPGGEVLSEKPQKLVRNIFKDEMLDDIMVSSCSGFKSASMSLKQGILDETNKNNVETTNFNNPKKNIYDGGNMPSSSGFKSASLTLNLLNSSEKNNIEGIDTVSKPKKNIFEGENFEDLKVPPNSGFKSASISLQENFLHSSEKNNADSINIVHKAAENIFKGESFDDLKVPPNCGFKLASTSLKQDEISNETDKKSYNYIDNKDKPIKNIFEAEDFSDINLIEMKVPETSRNKKNCSNIEPNTNETSSNVVNKNQSFKNLNLPNPMDSAVKNSFRNVFAGENFDDLNIQFDSNVGFKSSSSLKAVKIPSKPKDFRNIFEGENFDDLNLPALGPSYRSPLVSSKRNGFKCPFKTPDKNIVVEQSIDKLPENDFSGFDCGEKQSALNISETHCDIVNIMENRFKELVAKPNHASPLINLSSIDVLSKNLQSNKQKSGIELSLSIYNRNKGKKRKFSERDSDHNSISKNSFTNENLVQPGTSPATPLQNSFLKRPKKRLGCHFSPTIQIPEPVLKKAKLLFEDLEPKSVNTSTPVKFGGAIATPLQCNLTPIQGVRKNLGNSFLDVKQRDGSCLQSSYKNTSPNRSLFKSNMGLVRNKPTESYVEDTMERLASETQLLEERLRVLQKKQEILSNQLSAKGKKKILPGVLYNSKCKNSRIALREFVGNMSGAEEITSNNFLDQINPQNAHMVHFFVNDRLSHVQTEDGATIVPDVEGKVGVTEIDHSFKVMETVDPNLVPKRWVQNHYKWIVWKLASYERMYPDKFEGSLCIENVMQQLKYRYDIEIDQAKRSALHKVFEKDDCPQRRFVLCVSQIIRVGNSYELELTDGWYSIRTAIDEPLCAQIIKGKIKIGVKLMIYGAELMNCEGCHPLEATNLITLKINYNCTRRAIWWTKLGCQKDSGPFLVPLSSVSLEGGKIGCIKCFILRVYPVKYMEKYGERNVWRNRKAEERREQEFYNEKMKYLEKSNKSMCSDNGRRDQTYKGNNTNLLNSIKNIDDPETLYNLLQESCDPESIQESLSFSQKTLLYNYTLNKSAQNQSKIASNFHEKSRMFDERTVKSLLKIKVVDASCNSDLIHDFYVWEPQESHIQELREGEVVTIFNASCSSKFGLNANKSTQFKREPKPKDERFQKFRRKVTFIENLRTFSKEKCCLAEFDTVGLVVSKRIDDYSQQVWLTDSKKNLLVIKIYDSPKNILVLDSVSEGQIITACNILFKHSSERYSFGIADHFVVLSRYSQYRHLQEAVDTLQKELEHMDITTLLQSCKNKIDRIESLWDNGNPTLAWDIDDMECSQMTTTDLVLLECADKFMQQNNMK